MSARNVAVTIIVLMALGGITFAANAYFGGFFRDNFLVLEDHPDAPYPRLEPERYLGVWVSSLSRTLSNAFVKREDFRAIGANTVGFSIGVPHERDGTYNADKVREEVEETRDYIRYYKKEGLAVIMAPQIRSGGIFGVALSDPPEALQETYFENFKEVSVAFARLAEEENVEIFAPFHEPDRGGEYFDAERASLWMQEVLPEIRSVYSGKVLWKFDLFNAVREGVALDARGYDVVAFVTPVSAGHDVVEAITDTKIERLFEWSDKERLPEIIGIASGTSFPPRPEQVAWAVDMLFKKGVEGDIGGFGELDGFMVVDRVATVQKPIVYEKVRGWFARLRQ